MTAWGGVGDLTPQPPPSRPLALRVLDARSEADASRRGRQPPVGEGEL